MCSPSYPRTCSAWSARTIRKTRHVCSATAPARGARAVSRRDGQGLVFSPYAAFSPELAALRWARGHGVPVQAFDLPVGLAIDDNTTSRTRLAPPSEMPLTDALRRSARADDA